MRKGILITLILLIASVPVLAEESIVFTGVPEIKISEAGVNRLPETLTKDKATNFKCTITRMDGKYYWASRENVELLPIASGAFITYWAVNGSGYVRFIRPEMRGEVRKMGAIAEDPEARYDYVEHLLLGLESVTYYGKSK